MNVIVDSHDAAFFSNTDPVANICVLSGIFAYKSFSLTQHHFISSLKRRTSHPNAMDPRVEKLLEGKSDVVKSQAIVFAIACSSTRPTRNSSPEPSSFLGKPRRNRTPVKEPKFSFEESSDDEELSE
ncbi:uncharacterized protein [Montipora capricornis]|uniref:uncharacterized protein isoform X1 n=1 Tax=Montipora capricornis TaxID=246305 RepID=UPI0035F1EE36